MVAYRVSGIVSGESPESLSGDLTLTALPQVQPVWGRPLWESYGVCSHHFNNAAYGDVDAWTQKVADLGAYAFRSGAFSQLDQVKRAAVRARELGLKWLGTLANEQTTEKQLRANLDFVAANADVFIAVEGINEPDGEGLTQAEVDKTVRFQRIIWEFVTSRPELDHITVLSPALRRPAGPDLYQRFVDAGMLGTFHAVSLHHYLNGPPDMADLREHLDMVQGKWKCDRFWITETGGTTALESKDPRRNTEEALAAYAVRTLLEFRSDPRVEKVFRYELLDDAGPLTNNEAYFGLWRADGTQKPEIPELQTFLRAVHDTAEPYTPPPIDLEVIAPDGVQWMAIGNATVPPGETLWLWRPGVAHDVAPVTVGLTMQSGAYTVQVGGAAVGVPLEV